MAFKIRQVDYFYATVEDRPGQAYDLLSRLASSEVNLLVFGAVPVSAAHTQLTLFPDNAERLQDAAKRMGFSLMGPNRAFLIQGDDRLGALVEIHRKLYDANINVFASNGVTDGHGRYGYVVYVRPEDFEMAARVLEAA